MTRRLAAGLVGALALGIASGALAQIRPLNDSGQIVCYNDTASTGTVSSGTPDPESAGFNEQDCTRGRAAADTVGALRKLGASSAPGRDYTKIANNGSELPASALLGSGVSDWGCTRDNLSGLIWEVKTDDNGLRDKDHSYTWYDSNSGVNGGNTGSLGSNTTCSSSLINCNITAFRDAVNALAGSSRLCGQTDWRLPTAMDLQSLAYNVSSSPTIDASYFPNTLPGIYWSGVNYAADAADALVVSFNVGSLGPFSKPGIGQVRLVRGGP